MHKTFAAGLVTLSLCLLGSCSEEARPSTENEGGRPESGDGDAGQAGVPIIGGFGGTARPVGAAGDGGGSAGEPPIDELGGQAGAGGEPLGTGGEGNTPTIRIATFNIQNFGPTKLSRAEVMAELVEIVRRYPFVAVQEISDVNQQVPFAFLEMLNAEGTTYEMLLSPRSGQEPDDSTYQEQYAFYYDATVVSAVSEGQLYDDSPNDHFVREPYVARFAVAGGFTFVAITVHTQPDGAVAEIGHLDEVVDWAKDEFPDEDDFIVLGDLNAGCSYASPTELDPLGIRTDDYVWAVPDAADTNLAMSMCAYDRVIVTAATSSNYADTWGVDASFTSAMVSDHWPVWAEFWKDER